ncbi:MAG: uroporphyrinogen-III synthase, partial [Actinomycetota bacterium]
VSAPLGRIAATAKRAGIEPPAITVVGDVVGLREVLGGWDTRPLSGARVLVTRTREQAGELSAVLRELGAEVVEAPAIKVEPPRSWGPVDEAIRRLREGGYGWVAFTSANGVRFFFARLRAARLDARTFGRTKVAAVGTGTADALRAYGIEPDLIPPTFTTEAVGKAFPRGKERVLLARADVTEPGLEEALTAKGWSVERVTVYRLRSVNRLDPAVRRAVRDGEIDLLTFASGGTVRAFMKLLGGKPHRRTLIACIGPVTARAAKAAGLRVDAVAGEHTIPGLAAAATRAFSKRRR